MRDLIEDESLRELFAIPGLPEYVRGAGPETPSGQGALFADACIPTPHPIAASPPELYGLSVNAYNAAVLAALSELPLGASIPRFCRKVFSAVAAAENPGVAAVGLAVGLAEGVLAGEAARLAADRASSDRGDDDVRAVLDAAAKVTREIDRLRGLLRFRPDRAGIYIARCAPDHFVLPALAGHFELRFGLTPWAIIDEKRHLALVRLPGEKTRFVDGAAPLPSAAPGAFAENAAPPGRAGIAEKTARDGWEELWRTYHRSINNEARKNPKLQRQFIPERYRKYLTEM
jgi:probable DNA metabolism protein